MTQVAIPRGQCAVLTDFLDRHPEALLGGPAAAGRG